MKRVLFVTTGLGTGGAERVLARLVGGLREAGLEVLVVSLQSGGRCADQVRATGVSVEELGLGSLLDLPGALSAVVRQVRQFQPNVIQGWMYHGNLAAWWAGRAASADCAVFFGVRQSLPDMRTEKWATRLIILLGARLSGGVAGTIFNSEAGRQDHVNRGYAAATARCVPNGFDLTLFAPSADARRILRNRLGLPANARLVGLVARYHPIKDQAMFILAASLVVAQRRDTWFLLVGRDVGSARAGLQPLAEQLAISDRVIFLEEQPEVVSILAALDIGCLTSRAEGFPNAIGEAMACGTPCIATAVGDVGELIGDTGRTVAVGDAAALSKAVLDCLSMPMDVLAVHGRAARRRIEERFSETRMLHSYLDVYASYLS